MDKIEKIYQFGDFLIEERPLSSNSNKTILAIKDSTGKTKFIKEESSINTVKSKLEEFSKKTHPLDVFAQDTITKYDFSQKNVPEADILIANLKDKIISKDYVLENITPKIRKTVDKAKTKIQKVISKYEKKHLPVVEQLFKETILENKPSLNKFLFPVKYAEKIEKINSNLEKDVAKILAEPTKKKSIIAPIILGVGIGGILGGAYVFNEMDDANKVAIESLMNPNTRIDYIPLDPELQKQLTDNSKNQEIEKLNDDLDKANKYIIELRKRKPKDPTNKERNRRRPVGDDDSGYNPYDDIEWLELDNKDLQDSLSAWKNIARKKSKTKTDTIKVEVPGKDGQNRRYTVWKTDDGDYTGDFEDWAVDTVFVPTSNEQDKKRIADLEKQIGQNIKTILPKKIKVPGKNGKWMYVRNIFLTGNNEYQGQLEGLIPDTIKVEVPGKDGQNRRYVAWKTDDGDYTGDFEDFTVDTVYVAKKDPEDDKKIKNLEGQLAYWKNIKAKAKTDTIKVEVPGKDGQNRRYTVWKNDDGDYTGDFEDWVVDTVFVPTSNEAMKDTLNYWKGLYRNKKGDVYKSQINLNGLNLKVHPNTKIYKTNGGK